MNWNCVLLAEWFQVEGTFIEGNVFLGTCREVASFFNYNLFYIVTHGEVGTFFNTITHNQECEE